MNAVVQDKAYASNVLVPEVHNRLVMDIENVARAAGIPMHMIWTSATEFCEPEELDYTRHLPSKAADGLYGLVYVGTKHQKPVHMRMMALAGACVRNFINAKVMTLQDVLGALKKDAMPKPTVLLIPNFFVGKEQSGVMPQWQLSAMLGLLLNRQSEGLQTFVYVDDMAKMEAAYGDMLAVHVNTYFLRCE